ncbi:4a-hydroxytetrahydrobiopterin dehydratase [Nocardia testacea]|uniref:4a-hydroxytetrahydrobiopterin dehydratase n=1 Tax=Nocardia testacea TaxID=248551 RepID=UPI0033E4BA7E
MTALPTPLDDGEIADRLEALGWQRNGDEITRIFAHTYHECVHLAVYVAAKAREVGHHPDMLITWQRIEFRITTHDAGRRLTNRLHRPPPLAEYVPGRSSRLHLAGQTAAWGSGPCAPAAATQLIAYALTNMATLGLDRNDRRTGADYARAAPAAGPTGSPAVRAAVLAGTPPTRAVT